MKIGIITYWNNGFNNYGSTLQCWALQFYLKKLGHQPFLISYPVCSKTSKFFSTIFSPLKAAKFILKYIYKHVYTDVHFDRIQKNHIRNFYAKNICVGDQSFANILDLKSNPPTADIYIAGSDQIWNFYNQPLTKAQDCISAYFLDFGNKDIKRISYAASFGGDVFRQEYAIKIPHLLANFNAVSVREKSGITTCSQYDRNDAQQVLDPTMLLSAEDYRALYSKQNISIPEKKYVFVYLIKNKSAISLSEITNWAKAKNLEVVFVPGNGNRRKNPVPQTAVSVENWLKLVDNAEYVITNSYHCCVFSIMFKKQFAAVKQIDKFVTQNTRMCELFEMFGIKNVFFDKIESLEISPINYDIVQKNYDSYKKASDSFLISHCI